jgi:hypothetical protein
MACGGCGNRKPVRVVRSNKVVIIKQQPVSHQDISTRQSVYITQRIGVRMARS